MFVRLLIFFIFGVLIYRAYKTMTGRAGDPKVRTNGKSRSLQADDTMRQDPQCGIYVSARDSIVLNHNGRDLHFCSEACRDKFLEKSEK